MRERLGFIGLGKMGHPMAKNLERANFPLSVYNRTMGKALDFKDKSKVCESIYEVVDNSDILFTMLTNDAALTDVYMQIAQLDDDTIRGKLFVDMSTVSREKSLEIRKMLYLKEAGFIDAPVAGSIQPAADGALIIMVGGESKAVERAMPYLQKMGKLIKHLGGNGSGLSAKIAVNYFLSIIYQGLAETTLFADRLGLERKDILDIINASASGSGATEIKTLLLINENYAPAFALKLMLKDVLLAQHAGAGYPLGKVVVQSLNDAVQAGFGEVDVIGMIEYLRKNFK